MEIGSKTKKIVLWGATGLAAAGLLTGTFFTGMAVAENTEPASVASELDGELPDRPQRGEDWDGEGQDSDAQEREGRDSDARDGDAQEREDSDARDGDGPGPCHGHRDRHGDAPSEPEPSEPAPAESAPAESGSAQT